MPTHSSHLNRSRGDSGFTSPNRSTHGSAGKGQIKIKGKSSYQNSTHSIDFLNSNFQAIGKYAVTFQKYQKPGNLAVFQNLLAVSCRGREGCINLFKIGESYLSEFQPEINKVTNPGIRLISSFKIKISSQPVEPRGIKFDDAGNLFIATNNKICQISASKIQQLNSDFMSDTNLLQEILPVIPDRIIGKSCEMLFGLNFVNFGHFAVSDEARSAVSLIDRDTGCKVLDYTEHLALPLRKPRLISTTRDKDLIVTDDDRILFIDVKNNMTITNIYGGSFSKSDRRLSQQNSGDLSHIQTSKFHAKNYSNFSRPTAIFCDDKNSILIATKRRSHETINNRLSSDYESKLSLINCSGSILVEDVLEEKSLKIVGEGATGWESLPNFIDIGCSQGRIYLLGEQDKMVHCYSLVKN